MKISNKNIKILLILGISLIACSMSFKWFVNGCILWSCAPERSFEAEDILIPASYFPEGSDVGVLTKDRGIIYADEYFQGSSWDGGFSYFEIMKWANKRRAASFFESRERNIKFTSLDIPAGKVYPAPFYEAKGADQFKIKCGYFAGDLQCKFLSRYEEYYLYYQSSIDSEMQPEDFIEIVKYIDENMTYLLEK